MATKSTSALKNPDQIAARNLGLIEAYAEPIAPFLCEKNVLDVCVNEDGAVWVNRLGSGWSEDAHMETWRTSLFLSTLTSFRGLTLNEQRPVLETTLPSGDRLEGIIAPVMQFSVFAIRRRAETIWTLADYESAGIATSKNDPLNAKVLRASFVEQARGLSHTEIFRLSTRFRQNVLVVGATGSGKTSLCNAFMADWLEQTSQDRVVIIEDTRELQCAVPNRVQMLTCEAADQAKLLETALRLIPKRIVVGEVRTAKPAQVLIEAWNTGHRGGVATIHADDGLAGLRKLESFLGGHSGVIREQISDAIGLVVFIDSETRVSAGRKIKEVLAVNGFDLHRQDYELVRL